MVLDAKYTSKIIQGLYKAEKSTEKYPMFNNQESILF